MFNAQIILAFSSMLLLGLADNIRGPLFPELLKHFQLSQTQGSLFYADSAFFGILAGFAAPFLLKNLSRIRFHQLSLLFLALGLVGIATAPTYWIVLLVTAFLGLGFSWMGIAQNLFLMENSNPQHMGRLMSGMHSMYGLASLGAPLLVGFIASLQVDWKMGFVICALFAVAIIIQAQSLNGRVRVHESIQESHWPDRDVLWASLGLSIYVIGEIMVSSRMALFVREVHQVSLQDSTWYSTLFFIGMFSGRILFLFVPPPISTRAMVYVCLILTTMMVGVGLISSPWWLALSGFAIAPLYPMMMTRLGARFPDRLSQVSSAVITVSALFLVIGHYIMGELGDRFGITNALFAAALCFPLALTLNASWDRGLDRGLDKT